MKQIILLSIFFFCSFFTSAQKTISKEDFESLVDYANSNYVMAFIEKNDVEKPYYTDTYEKKVKPELEKASLDNFETIPNYQEISELLVNNAPALKLAGTINERKNDFDNAQSNKSLIEVLRASEWKEINLIQTADIILNECLRKYNINDISYNQGIAQEQTTQFSTHAKQPQQQNDKSNNDTKIIEFQKSLNIFKLIVLSAFILLVVLLLVFFFLLKKKLREYLINQVLESYRIEKKFALKEAETYSLSEEEISIIVDRVLKLKQKKEEEIQNQSKTSKNEIFEVSKPAIKYLKGKSGKIFTRTENNSENSFFKLFNESDDSALFEFWGDEAEALAKRIFSDDICTIVSGNYQNARSIETSKPGKIKRVGEQWEVIEPIQIKLT